MLLQLSDIEFVYPQGRKPVLKDVNLELALGDTLAIVGASGCGKSTLLRIISGLAGNKDGASLSGRICINGLSPDEYIRTGKLAFMFQEPTLFPNLTVRDNIALPLKIKGLRDDAKVVRLLQTVGLTEYASYLPKQLSGGMKARVALARCFATPDPELLLLDEPFSALDIAWKSKLYTELAALTDQFGTSIIIVTHDVQEALLLSREVAVMNRYGAIQSKQSIQTSRTLPDRVNDISGYLNEVYTDYLIPIQKAIITDGSRSMTTRAEALEGLQRLEKAAGGETSENACAGTRLNYIREHAQDPEINQRLIDLFHKAITPHLKYKLIWEILEFGALPMTLHKEISDYYFEHLAVFAGISNGWYGLRADATTAFFEILMDRIASDTEFRISKKWIYLCDLYAVRELPEVMTYLNEVIAGKIQKLNYPFAIQIAQRLKDKIINEKASASPFV